MTNPEFDVVVIGAGAGGLFTAARLANEGRRVLVVERLAKVGGRASTTNVDGFKVNDGAIVIEVGGITEQTFAELGIPWKIREPSPPILYRIKGKDVDVTGGGWGFMLSKLTRQGAKLVSELGAARNDSGLPEDEITTDEWVRKFTKNEGVRGIFRNMCASIFAVSSTELPARVFLTYFTRKSAFKRFGFHPEGTIGVWQQLAENIESNGGEIWCSASADRILVDEGRVTGIEVDRDGQRFTVSAPVVISNVGPAATLDLVEQGQLPVDYVEEITRKNRPCAMIALNFASQKRIIEAPGMLSFASTRRMAYVANFTDSCPEMSPAGWNLYVAASVPEPAIGDFDEAAEIELLRADLRDNFPGFEDNVRELGVTVTRDGWPPQRAVAGFDMPHDTPLGGLWNVGDGVKEYANGGTTACAETAQIVTGKVQQYLSAGK